MAYEEISRSIISCQKVHADGKICTFFVVVARSGSCGLTRGVDYCSPYGAILGPKRSGPSHTPMRAIHQWELPLINIPPIS